MSIALLYERSEPDEMGIKLTAKKLGVELAFIPFRKIAFSIYNNNNYWQGDSMSQEDEGYGYGIDIGYVINREGIIDFEISESGDIRIIGAGEGEAISEKRKNAIQQIILRILTPYGTVFDENGRPIAFGSELHSMIGMKDTDLNRMAIQAYVMSCLQDYAALEAITEITVDFIREGIIQIKLGVKLKDDNEILFETFTICGQ